LSFSYHTVSDTVRTSQATQSIISSTFVLLAGTGMYRSLTSSNDEATTS
jgi:hypothetical protein